jgi:hypothetical protein
MHAIRDSHHIGFTQVLTSFAHAPKERTQIVAFTNMLAAVGCVIV